MKFRILCLAAVISNVLAGGAFAADAQDGELDTTWNASGKVVVSFNEGGSGNNFDRGGGVAVGPEGSLYIAGYVSGVDGLGRIGVVKRDPSGGLSPVFSPPDSMNLANVTGILDNQPVKAALSKQGNTTFLLVAATRRISATDTDMIVCRFNALTGANQAFGAPHLPPASGCTTAPLVLGLQAARDILVQPDGKFIVIGTHAASLLPNEKYVYAVRFNADGSQDVSFSPTPKRDVSRFISHEPRSAALANNGKIVIVGSTKAINANGVDGLVMRIGTDGEPDDISPFGGERSFSIDGSPDRDTVFADLILERNAASNEDAIVAVGFSEFAQNEIRPIISKLSGQALVSLDSDFGEFGGYSYPPVTGVSYSGIAAHPCKGYVVIADAGSIDPNGDVVATAWTRSGSPNDQFGQGLTAIDFIDGLNQVDHGRDILASGDGIYVAGEAFTAMNEWDFAGAKLYMDSIFCDGYEVD